MNNSNNPNYRKQSFDRFNVIGISERIDPKDSKYTDKIKSLWSRFYKENILQQIPFKENDQILAIYYHYESDQNSQYSFMIGSKVSLVKEVPKGLELIHIPSQDYFIFKAKGEFPDSLMKTWEEIWEHNVHRAFSYDFEVYDDNFQNLNQRYKEVDIYISVKKPDDIYGLE